MADLAPRKTPFKDALAEHVEAPDPLAESVMAFHEGAMNAEDRTAFAARLETEPEARELLDELRAFEKAEIDDGLDAASEFEVASTLRAIRQREQAAPRTPTSAPPRRTWMAVAALAALSLGLGTAWLDTRQELLELRSAQPEAGLQTGPKGLQTATIHHLTGRELRSSPDEPVPQIRGDTGRHVLVITPSLSLEAGQIVSCTITRAGSDERLVGPLQVATTEDGLLILSLEKDLPSAGDYELRLADPASGEQLETFPFQWGSASS